MPQPPFPTLVVMGVAGCGKSRVGQALAAALDATFLEGDVFHPAENIARMAAGIPLTDADRAGWLTILADRLALGRQRGERMVLACSALKRRYRDRLRQGDPALAIVHLAGEQPLIEERMARRQGHFMPLSLLASQFRDLEPPEADETALRCAIDAAPDDIVAQVLERLSTLPSGHPVPAS